jgi:hypothetical protein
MSEKFRRRPGTAHDHEGFSYLTKSLRRMKILRVNAESESGVSRAGHLAPIAGVENQGRAAPVGLPVW